MNQSLRKRNLDLKGHIGRKMKRRICLTLIFTFLISVYVVSANVEMYLNKNILMPQETLNLTIIVKGYGLENYGKVKFPDIPGFIKVDNQESELPSIVGGKKFILRKYIFSYIPTKSGIFYIPPISIRLPEGVYKSKRIEIRVLNPDGSINKTVYSPPQKNVEKPILKKRKLSLKENVKLVREMDTLNPYEGEQIVLTYKILTRKSINQNVVQSVVPEYSDFWVENITDEVEHNYQTVILSGIKYYSIILQKLVLFPLKSGKLKIDGTKWVIKVKDINPPFKETPKELSVKPIMINVKPIPKENIPSNFKGDVGDYEINVNYRGKNLEVGKTTSIYLTIKGAGNVSAITCPKISVNKDFKILDIKTVHSKFGFYPFKHYGERLLYGGEKVWQVFFYPIRSGKVIFPSINFSFFNPFLSKFISISTKPIVFNVMKSRLTSSSVPKYTNKKIKIKKGKEQELKITIILVLALILFFILFLFFRKKRGDGAVPYEVKLERKIEDLFENVEKNIDKYRTKSFFEVVYTFICDILLFTVGIEIKGMTKEEIRDLLIRKKFKMAHVDSIIEMVELCDMVRFSKTEVEEKKRREIIVKLKEIWNEYKYRRISE